MSFVVIKFWYCGTVFIAYLKVLS